MNSNETIGESRMDRKKEATKQKIIAAAMKLFKKPGFDATTMEQISQKVDIAKGTLYNYFPVKEAIISEYLQRILQEKRGERIEKLQKMPDTRTRLIFIFSELVEVVQTSKEIFEKYLVYRMQNIVAFNNKEEAAQDEIQSLITAIVESGQQNAEIRQDLPVNILADLFEFAFIEVVKQYYLEPEKFNTLETINQSVDILIHGAKQKPARKSRKTLSTSRETGVIELVWNPEPDGGHSDNNK